jgi:hypothetical protein
VRTIIPDQVRQRTVQKPSMAPIRGSPTVSPNLTKHASTVKCAGCFALSCTDQIDVTHRSEKGLHWCQRFPATTPPLVPATQTHRRERAAAREDLKFSAFQRTAMCQKDHLARFAQHVPAKQSRNMCRTFRARFGHKRRGALRDVATAPSSTYAGHSAWASSCWRSRNLTSAAITSVLLCCIWRSSSHERL